MGRRSPVQRGHCQSTHQSGTGSVALTSPSRVLSYERVCYRQPYRLYTRAGAHNTKWTSGRKQVNTHQRGLDPGQQDPNKGGGRGRWMFTDHAQGNVSDRSFQFHGALWRVLPGPVLNRLTHSQCQQTPGKWNTVFIIMASRWSWSFLTWSGHTAYTPHISI